MTSAMPTGPDRLLLEEASDRLASCPSGGLVIIGDPSGALTMAAAQAGAQDIRVFHDDLAAERALATAWQQSSAAVAPFRNLDMGPDLFRDATLILLRMPKHLRQLERIAALGAAYASDSVVLIGSARTAHMSRSMNEALATYFGDVSASLGRYKSRALTAAAPLPVTDSVADRVGYEEVRQPELGLTLCAYPGTFAGARLDIGTRLLLTTIGQPEVAEALAASKACVDLGCGNGVVAATLAKRFPGAHIIATDHSRTAVASATATLVANDFGDRVRVLRTEGLRGVPDESADVILCNPPFHDGATIDQNLATALFRDSARVLRCGGSLITVFNSHLQYRPRLTTIVGPTKQLARDRKFTVTQSTKDRSRASLPESSSVL